MKVSTSQKLAPFIAGTVASITGSLATFGIVIAGLVAMGANEDQVGAALVILLFAYGILSILLSVWFKMPISVVWSTPGAAFLASSAALGLEFEVAVGAFVVSNALLLLTGIWPKLGELVGKIPPQISAAMLAGVIFSFVTSTVSSAVDFPQIMLPVLAIWLLLYRFASLWASAVAISVGFLLIGFSPLLSEFHTTSWIPVFGLVWPAFDLGAILAIGIPLYLITMASQNLPGLAIMSSLGYQIPGQKALVTIGGGSLLTSFFGGFGLNLAAITAALNADEHAAKDPARRWVASSWGGVVYLIFGILAIPFAAFVLAVPRELLLGLGGIALLLTFANALKTAVLDDTNRLAGIVTFLVGATGVSILGIGAAFWALLAGVLIWLMLRVRVGRGAS